MPQETGSADSQDSDSDSSTTVEIPLSAFDTPPAEGDTISLKVISVDVDNGVINATPIESEDSESGGSDSLAADFDATKTQ